MEKSLPKLDYKKLNIELGRLTSVEEKLNYIKTISEKLNSSPNYEYSIFSIIDNLSDEHFPNKKDPNFTFWFLKYNANCKFKIHITSDEFKHRLASHEKLQFLKDQLGAIDKKEMEARDLRTKEKFDYYKNYKYNSRNKMYLFNQNIKPIEILRVLDGNYYTNKHTTHDYTVIESPEVDAYFSHILLKSHLQKLLKQTIDPEKKQNPFPLIFKDLDSYEIFTLLHEQFKTNTRTQTADYSFIFYAMKADGFILCRGTDFIAYLSEQFQIEIDRIDSRQYGKSRKTQIYEVIKKRNKSA